MPALVNVLSLLVAFMQLAGARRYPQDLTHTPDVTLQLYKSQVQVVWMSTYSSISSNTSSMVFASSSHPSPGLAPRFTGLRTLRLLIPPTCYHLHTELDLGLLTPVGILISVEFGTLLSHILYVLSLIDKLSDLTNFQKYSIA